MKNIFWTKIPQNGHCVLQGWKSKKNKKTTKEQKKKFKKTPKNNKQVNETRMIAIHFTFNLKSDTSSSRDGKPKKKPKQPKEQPKKAIYESQI